MIGNDRAKKRSFRRAHPPATRSASVASPTSKFAIELLFKCEGAIPMSGPGPRCFHAGQPFKANKQETDELNRRRTPTTTLKLSRVHRLLSSPFLVKQGLSLIDLGYQSLGFVTCEVVGHHPLHHGLDGTPILVRQSSVHPGADIRHKWC